MPIPSVWSAHSWCAFRSWPRFARGRTERTLRLTFAVRQRVDKSMQATLAEALEDHVRGFLALGKEEPAVLRIESEGDRTLTFIHVTRDLETFSKEELELQVGFFGDRCGDALVRNPPPDDHLDVDPAAEDEAALYAVEALRDPAQSKSLVGIQRRKARARLLPQISKESEGVGSPIEGPLNLLVVGDVVGAPGREVLKRCVALLREQHKIHACIVNGENAAGGFGLTAQTAEEIFATGVDFITGGNHIFDKRDFAEYLERSARVIRPANYPPAVPGQGAATFTVDGVVVGVLNLMGRTFMPPVDDPFRSADALPRRAARPHPDRRRRRSCRGNLRKSRSGAIPGRPRLLVFGTHTHVQTSDEQILPGGTAYISDLGMTGPTDGVIGMEAGAVLERFLTGISERFSVQKTGPKQFCGAVVSIDPATGKANEIKRIFLKGIA